MEQLESEASNSNSSILTELVTTITTTPTPTSHCTSATALEDDSKCKDKQPEKNAHVPYILNGELYEIQTQDGENVTVKCCHCPPDRVYRGSVRSTGNFHMHIKRRHPDLLGKLHDMKVNALLERRDRLIRNRKIVHRTNNSRNHTNIKPELQAPSSPPTNLTPSSQEQQTHKLKIKRAFQQHQLQQQEAMRNWNDTTFVVVPVTKSAEAFEQQPINYSFKENNCNNKFKQIRETQSPTSQSSHQTDDIQINSQTRSIIPTVSSEQTVGNVRNNAEFTLPQPCLYQNHVEQQAPIRDAVTNLTPCPSTASSYGSNVSTTTMAIVKNETLTAAEQAIDLTLQHDSNTSISSSGIGSTLAFGINSPTTNNATFKWNELLLQVETSLRDIQREMRTRNQIETNRILLDIAKFKYAHPGFNFQY